MSLFDNCVLYLPSGVALKPISNGSKFLYMLLLHDYSEFGTFLKFIPNDYKGIMCISCRQLYRYFYELIAYDCILEVNSYYKFKFL